MKKGSALITTIIFTTIIIVTLALTSGANAIKNVESKGTTEIRNIVQALNPNAAQNNTTEATTSKSTENNATTPSTIQKASTVATSTPASSTATPSSVTTKQASSTTSSTAKSTNEVETAAPTASAVSTDDGQAQINLNNLNNGTVSVKYSHPSSLKIKVKIAKGGSSYIYDLISTSGYETFPLQMGNGDYTVTVLKNVGGTSYSSVNTFNVSLANSSGVFLSSIQLINWNASTNAVVKASAIASGLGSSQAKVQAVHDFLISYMSYRAVNASSSYIPNISQVYSQRSGMCYDFASTYAAMMRSVGVPTKLVMGTSSNVNGYHAWNEVYINGGWAIVDNSYDSQVKAAGQNLTMIKSSSQYSKQKEY